MRWVYPRYTRLHNFSRPRPPGRTWRWASQPTFFRPNADPEPSDRHRAAPRDGRARRRGPRLRERGRERCGCSSTTPTASTWPSASGSRDQLRDLLVDYALEVSSPGPERPLTKPDHFRRFLGRRARVRTREPRDGHRSFTGELVGATDEEVTVAADDGGSCRSRTPRSTAATLLEGRAMTKEIVEAITSSSARRASPPTASWTALEDALLSAYKKTPGAAKYARVDMDHDSGDFRVFELLLPRGPRGAAARRGRGGGRRADRRPGDGRDARARGARDRPGAARRSTATRSTSAT